MQAAVRGQDGACRQGVEESYFDDVVTAAPHLPTWVGELYLETHRGTYTTQGEIKRSNRKNELLLREAELYGVLANLKGTEIDVATLRSAWLDLLLLQFHDILPGSSIGAVYEEAAVDHAGIKATASGVRQAALRALAQEAGPDELVVFNSMSWPRSDLVRAVVPVELVKERDRLALQQSDGTIIPVQELGRDPDEVELLFNPSGVPGVGVAGLKLLAAVDPIESSLRVSTSALENRFFRMELDGKGGISRLFDKRFGREVVPPGCTANDLQLFQDGPEREAAWNVHATFDKRRYAWDDGLTVHVLEKGPVRASVRVVRRYRDSVLAQDVILYDQVPRIDFVTRVDWRARQVMLKAAFPVSIRSPRATYEVQFGAVERATHRNTSWEEEKFEVCAHRWADLSEAGYGVSLLNDCKYGYDVLENVMRLTLLRGAEWPDPLADVGKHEFVYSLLPHTGDWRDGGTVQYAWELNAPMTCAVGAGSGSGEAWNESLLAVRGPAILEALKPAEDGDGVIARLYEPYGGRGAVWVATPADRITVVPCNHVEEAQSDVDVRVEGGGFGFSVTPYQVRSFRLWFE